MFHSFEDAKETALSCRDKRVGKRLGRYSLCYIPEQNYVHFYYHDTGASLAKILPNNTIILTASNSDLSQSVRHNLRVYLGIIIASLPRNRLQQYENIQFYFPTYAKLYVPNETTFDMWSRLLSAGRVKKFNINKKWNKQFTALSRKFREQLAAKDKFLPNDLITDQSMHRLTVDTIWEHMHAKDITANMIVIWRQYCDSYKPIRKAAQELINSTRWTIAKRQNAVEWEIIDQNDMG